MMELSDESLVEQALGLNDTEAYGVLVRRHQARILLLQKRFARDPALAEDLCQETFLRAWRKLHTFGNSGSFKAWLAKIAYNVFLQQVRRDRVRLNSTSTASDVDLTPAAPVSDELPDLDRLLGILSEEEQLVLILNYGHGLSNSEIGQVLSVPAGTVKSQIHRAKAKIRERFSIAQTPPSAALAAGSRA